MNKNSLKVNCYSGHTYAERPKAFEWQGIKYEVEKVERAWQEPGERHFQVQTKDNILFQLCYNETQKQWTLVGAFVKGSLKGAKPSKPLPLKKREI